MTDRKWGVVVVAAGSGSRFGGEVPKQFRLLRGRPVIDWSVDTFLDDPSISSVVVVLPADGDWKRWWVPGARVTVADGGSRRQDSVLNGLGALDDDVTHVLVHDAARPLVSSLLVRRVMDAVAETGAVPVIPVRDTVRRFSDDDTPGETLPREDLWLTQTPQGYRLDLLLSVLAGAGDVTDEASALEEAGHGVVPVPGDRMNVKLTLPDDMEMLERLAGREGSSASTRLGSGLDFHPFRDDRPLIVAGCRLSEEGGLLGHSDGDVVLHAIADGILSAARLGDIGTLFPPGDERWKDADSSDLLRRVSGMAEEEGFQVRQVDVTLIGERPKVAFHREPMIERIASILEIEPELVWVKGTTTNTMGDLGRGKGLACSALVLLERT
jgi:2-C-methyl-D-erythritol 4-phosphate cytidylyltransferase/2-C-methyl-D-erythritol 2,4-cyclodiphosphate synthase